MGLWSRLFKKDRPSSTTRPRSTYEQENNKSEKSNPAWTALEDRLQIALVPVSRFEKVLRHRSTKESSSIESYETYERYEYLGDAVLDLAVAEILFERYPHENEGFLTKFRSKLVKKETLAMLAKAIQLTDVIQFGDRTTDPTVRESKSVLADLFESLLGGLFLTYGYDRVKNLVETLLDEEIHFDEVSTKIDNYKSMLLELCQAKKWEQPVYELVSEQGPGHKKVFTVSVSVNQERLGEGKGSRLKQAEQHAAKVALQHLNQSV